MSEEKALLDTLTTIDREYAENKQKFEKWKVDNRRQEGTKEYIGYVHQFVDWERHVLEKKQSLLANLQQSTAYNDAAIKKVLDGAKPMEFLMALMTMSMRDKTFLKSVLTVSKRVNTANDVKASVAAHSAMPQIHGPVNFSIPPPNIAALYRSNAVPSTIGSNLGSYGYSGRADLATKPPVPVPAHWTSEPAIPRSFRPPSPVREYKSPTVLPFRDFSQN